MATKLDRKLVAETALGLLNEVGLEGLTLRRIAKELNVQAPALYWHFKNKQELLDEMATELYERMTAPLVAAGPGYGGGGWKALLTASCRVIRRTLLTYRDGGKVFGGTRMNHSASMRPMEISIGALTAAGFRPHRAARAWFTVYTYTIGYVVEEQSVFPVPGEPLRDPTYDLDDRERRYGADFPLTVVAGEEFFGDTARGFEDGLRAVIAGIEATLLHGE